MNAFYAECDLDGSGGGTAVSAPLTLFQTNIKKGTMKAEDLKGNATQSVASVRPPGPTLNTSMNKISRLTTSIPAFCPLSL
ncbi:hypothetical protein J6590_018998 [Homalodisca vitripennis]|nr:hypothetical protein J6590_018998 [Homalodisca vitripennis]